MAREVRWGPVTPSRGRGAWWACHFHPLDRCSLPCWPPPRPPGSRRAPDRPASAGWSRTAARRSPPSSRAADPPPSPRSSRPRCASTSWGRCAPDPARRRRGDLSDRRCRGHDGRRPPGAARKRRAEHLLRGREGRPFGHERGLRLAVVVHPVPLPRRAGHHLRGLRPHGAPVVRGVVAGRRAGAVVGLARVRRGPLGRPGLAPVVAGPPTGPNSASGWSRGRGPSASMSRRRRSTTTRAAG
jgi:hypothetical protein